MAIMSRRAFVSSVALAGVSVLAGGVSRRSSWAQGTAPALVTTDMARPSIPYGVASALSQLKIRVAITISSSKTRALVYDYPTIKL